MLMCCAVLASQTLAVDLAGDLMFLLPPSSYSSYFIPMQFVEGWKTVAPLFCRELEVGSHMVVRRVGDTFLVVDPAPGNAVVNFAHPHRPMMFWLLLVNPPLSIYICSHVHESRVYAVQITDSA